METSSPEFKKKKTSMLGIYLYFQTFLGGGGGGSHESDIKHKKNEPGKREVTKGEKLRKKKMVLKKYYRVEVEYKSSIC